LYFLKKKDFSFQNCIEQIFDNSVTVSKNPLLQEEFAAMIRHLLTNIESKLGRKRILFFFISKFYFYDP